MAESNKKVGRTQELRKNTINNVVILITTAFGLVAALAWNTAIQTVFTDYFGKQTTVLAMLGYAVAVTIVAVVVITYMSKLTVKDETK